MKYILSNAQILKQSRLVDSDILIDHGNIVSISGSAPADARFYFH